MVEIRRRIPWWIGLLATISVATANGIERNVVPPRPSNIFREDPRCKLSDSGFYGQFNQNPRSVNFLYQVNVIDGVTTVDIQQDLGPMINREIVQGILPQLFPEDCAGRRRNLREITTRKLQNTTDPNIVGVSAQQMDLATGLGVRK